MPKGAKKMSLYNEQINTVACPFCDKTITTKEPSAKAITFGQKLLLKHIQVNHNKSFTMKDIHSAYHDRINYHYTDGREHHRNFQVMSEYKKITNVRDVLNNLDKIITDEF